MTAAELAQRRTKPALAAAAPRHCATCGGELSEGARVDAIYHGGACRARMHRTMPAQLGKRMKDAAALAVAAVAR